MFDDAMKNNPQEPNQARGKTRDGTTKDAAPAQAVDQVLADSKLTREQKIRRLIDLYRDALELEVAAGEGMAPPRDEASGLHRIQRAIEELGGADRIPPSR